MLSPNTTLWLLVTRIRAERDSEIGKLTGGRRAYRGAFRLYDIVDSMMVVGGFTRAGASATPFVSTMIGS